MPRGRHRHSPPLHRLLPPSAIAGVSAVCALAPWVFSQAMVLRGLAAVAALTAVTGAVVMRHWDSQAGKQVADLVRARASDEWRFEERVAELETDLEESRELRGKLEQRLRAKRTELAGLRNEHAALLRRYATAETERATALEGRRLLEIEAAPARALPPVPVSEEDEPEVEVDAEVEAVAEDETEAVAAAVEEEAEAAVEEEAVAEGDAEEEPEAPAIFSPEGSQLFLRAKVALSRLDEGDESGEDVVEVEDAAEAETPEPAEAPKGDGSPKGDDSPDGDGGPKGDVPAKDIPAQAGPVAAEVVEVPEAASASETSEADTSEETVQEDEAQGKPVAVDGHERAAATTTTAKPGQPPRQSTGHFVAPTAVAVVPAAPVRRPAVEGGFDFFGTQKSSSAMEAVQNEDLADVVGQEALALHKAESEGRFKPVDEASRGIGQVIDLTVHDETEHIDLKGLRSAVS